ncbi:hypothetical protein RIR_jg27952.t1 [Rhizophagus irregularis DAOM 181602=DAOM 197198]|nr:hypothetical protein RIR_jg27952.t1 [Rhizophagus irregularis DAOM 181602=DAOM 197198]
MTIVIDLRRNGVKKVPHQPKYLDHIPQGLTDIKSTKISLDNIETKRKEMMMLQPTQTPKLKAMNKIQIIDMKTRIKCVNLTKKRECIKSRLY